MIYQITFLSCKYDVLIKKSLGQNKNDVAYDVEQILNLINEPTLIWSFLHLSAFKKNTLAKCPAIKAVYNRPTGWVINHNNIVREMLTWCVDDFVLAASDDISNLKRYQNKKYKYGFESHLLYYNCKHVIELFDYSDIIFTTHCKDVALNVLKHFSLRDAEDYSYYKNYKCSKLNLKSIQDYKDFKYYEPFTLFLTVKNIIDLKLLVNIILNSLKIEHEDLIIKRLDSQVNCQSEVQGNFYTIFQVCKALKNNQIIEIVFLTVKNNEQIDESSQFLTLKLTDNWLLELRTNSYLTFYKIRSEFYYRISCNLFLDN